MTKEQAEQKAREIVESRSYGIAHGTAASLIKDITQALLEFSQGSTAEEKIYLRKHSVQKIEDCCDLGDSTSVEVYKYPHRDALPDMVCFYSHPQRLVVPESVRGALEAADNAIQLSLSCYGKLCPDEDSRCGIAYDACDKAGKIIRAALSKDSAKRDGGE